jgi:hypothetical protein
MQYLQEKLVKEFGPTYKYMGSTKKGYANMGDASLKGKPTSKDSTEYLEGYSKGVNKVKARDKNLLGEKYIKGIYKVGMSGRYNEGYSEGKDAAIDIKNKSKKK